MSKNKHQPPIILFDGVCKFCNASVSFIIRHRWKEDFHFIPLQSAEGKKFLELFHLPANYTDSVVLVEDGKLFLKSTAALRIARKLNPAYSWWSVFIFIPRFIRDRVYDWIAAHRNSWFKSQETCEIPDYEYKKRGTN
jgi:predicted DCC family thiol-disulfide oxidoreductase YuxK